MSIHYLFLFHIIYCGCYFQSYLSKENTLPLRKMMYQENCNSFKHGLYFIIKYEKKGLNSKERTLKCDRIYLFDIPY